MRFSIPDSLIEEIKNSIMSKVGNRTRVPTNTTENIFLQILANSVRQEKYMRFTIWKGGDTTLILTDDIIAK